MTATAYIVLARIAGGSRLSLSVHIKEKGPHSRDPFTRTKLFIPLLLYRQRDRKKVEQHSRMW